MITTCTRLQPEKLPPTSRAIYYHALRVNLQVCQWKYLKNDCLNADEWEWKHENGILVPVKTDQQPAPEWILKFVRCKCKTSSKNTCGSMVSIVTALHVLKHVVNAEDNSATINQILLSTICRTPN